MPRRLTAAALIQVNNVEVTLERFSPMIIWEARASGAIMQDKEIRVTPTASPYAKMEGRAINTDVLVFIECKCRRANAGE